MSNQGCLAAAVLAGGRARRLGGIDKSALTLDGVPIMDRLLAVVRRITPRVFAVGDRYGAAAHAGLPVVPDSDPDGGVLGAIYTAIIESPCERTLVVGCDMPFITEAFLAHLAELSACGRGETPPDIVMPRTAAGFEPLCAIYARTSAEAIADRLQRGERLAAVPPGGVRVLEVGPEEIAAYDPHGMLFVNVNTPHDYTRARRSLANRNVQGGLRRSD